MVRIVSMQTETNGEFVAFVRKATRGKDPYPYQREIARRGLPRLLDAPTGSGKTAAAVLPWLWRLTRPGAEAEGTCPRLVYVLPMRTLVEQTVGEVRGWLANLGLEDQVRVQMLMGGAEHDDDLWQLKPSDKAILVGTQDMILSRALMRGYAERRSHWPVSFGLLHAGTQWVFDEIQLLGPALGTSAQLQGLRDALGTALPTATMWMSATLDPADLETPDHSLAAAGEEPLRIGPADHASGLGVRLNARRRFARLDLPDDAKSYAQALARELAERHVAGTQTIAFCNTVERACSVFEALKKRAPAPELLLVHSRFRPAEREKLTERLRKNPEAAGRIVVATQALEAGVDVSSRLLFSESAPWSSLVQRAGRCNRAGEWPGGADILWSPPPKSSAAPYQAEDLRSSEQALTALEGRSLTTLELQGLKVESSKPVHALLRRRDLLQLFDTLPDLSGADIDVGPWIRDAQESTAFVAWRVLEAGGPEEKELFPARAELCPAPVGDVRKLLRDGRTLWAYDRLDGGWKRALQADVVPGAVFLADASKGGYSSETGWAPRSRQPVEPVPGAAVEPDALSKDVLSHGSSSWVSLARHLADVEQEVPKVLREYGRPFPGLPEELLKAAALAGRFHDLGKAHPAFQAMLLSTREEDEESDEGLWAKSRRPGGRPARPYLRHELVSALMLAHPECTLLDGQAEKDLIVYLAAAHHGKVRVSVRSMPGEEHRVLGVQEGDETPPVEFLDGDTVPPLKLSLASLRIGADETGSASWTSRALKLRDREDLGPFRLAFLESVVRIADWRVSRSYRGERV